MASNEQFMSDEAIDRLIEHLNHPYLSDSDDEEDENPFEKRENATVVPLPLRLPREKSEVTPALKTNENDWRWEETHVNDSKPAGVEESMWRKFQQGLAMPEKIEVSLEKLDSMFTYSSKKSNIPKPTVLADIDTFFQKSIGHTVRPDQLDSVLRALEIERRQDGGTFLKCPMGHGKTLITLLLICSNPNLSQTKRTPRTTLILVTSTILLNWIPHLERYLDPKDYYVYGVIPKISSNTGDPIQQRDTRYDDGKPVSREQLQSYKVVISTYDTLVTQHRDYNQRAARLTYQSRDPQRFLHPKPKQESLPPLTVLKDLHWYRVVLEEGHNVRNDSSQKFEACHELFADHRMIISGTPFQNNMIEFLTLCKFLRIYPLDTWWARMIFFNYPKKSTQIAAARRLNVLSAILQANTVRNALWEGKKPVPLPKLSTTIHTVKLDDEKFTENFWESDPRQKGKYVIPERWFQLYVQAWINERRSKSDDTRKYYKVLKRDQRLAQLTMGRLASTYPAAHFAKYGSRNPEDMAENVSKDSRKTRQEFNERMRLVEGAWKSTVILKVVEITRLHFQNFKGKVVCFGFTLPALDAIRAGLEQHRITCASLDGYNNDKWQTIEDFQTRDAPQVLLCSNQTGGEGIELTRATRVIQVDLHWNPQRHFQTVTRVYRHPQKQEVHWDIIHPEFSVTTGVLTKLKEKLFYGELMNEDLVERDPDVLRGMKSWSRETLFQELHELHTQGNSPGKMATKAQYGFEQFKDESTAHAFQIKKYKGYVRIQRRLVTEEEIRKGITKSIREVPASEPDLEATAEPEPGLSRQSSESSPSTMSDTHLDALMEDQSWMDDDDDTASDSQDEYRPSSSSSSEDSSNDENTSRRTRSGKGGAVKSRHIPKRLRRG